MNTIKNSLIFFLIVLSYSAKGQLAMLGHDTSPFETIKLELKTHVLKEMELENHYSLIDKVPSPILSAAKKQASSFPYKSQLVALYGCYKYEDLAAFCKIEYKLEKVFKFPIKIRLGEVHYAEKREGKKGY